MKKFVKIFFGISLSAILACQSIPIFADNISNSSENYNVSDSVNENDENNLFEISDEVGDKATDIAYLMEIIKKYYTGSKVSVHDLYRAAAIGIMNSLDDYSEFFSGDELNEFMSTVQEIEVGVGIEISRDEAEYPYIYKIYVGSPAYKAGIRQGDIVLEINGKSTKGVSLETVIPSVINKGDIISLKILREKDTVIEKDIVVDEVFKPTVESCRANELPLNIPAISNDKAKNIGYISIISFGENTDEEFSEIIKNFNKEGIRNFVIDLRMNGGGVIESALNMAEMFTPENELMCKILEKNQTSEVFSENKENYADNVVIIVDEFTASASELFSGILGQNGAIIVGKNTFGKGVGQTIAPIGQNDSFKLTTEEILLKNDVKINGVGISPLYVVDTYEYLKGDEKIDDPILKKILGVLGYSTETRENVFSAICNIQEKNKIEVTGNMNIDTSEIINNIIVEKNFSENKAIEKSLNVIMEKMN